MSLLYFDRETGDYLQHYGVLGMRWGVRKNKAKSLSQKLKSGVTQKAEEVSQSIKDTAYRVHKARSKGAEHLYRASIASATASGIGASAFALIRSSGIMETTTIGETLGKVAGTGALALAGASAASLGAGIAMDKRYQKKMASR